MYLFYLKPYKNRKSENILLKDFYGFVNFTLLVWHIIIEHTFQQLSCNINFIKYYFEINFLFIIAIY